MDLTVFIAVITAALLHATWNAVVKGGSDKLLGMTAIVLGHIPPAAIAIPFVPSPDPASWPWLAGGVALHTGYQFFLLSSYRIGDLTQVYPIARGTAPMLVAGVTIVFLGVNLSRSELLAIALIGTGIMSLSLVRQQDGQHNARAAVLAFATGCFIAGYSLVDGLGARQAGTAVGFYSWLTIINGLVFAVLMSLWQPGIVRRLPREAPVAFLFGGSASYVAYGLVIWSFTHAPIALVTALRETSIIFALLIGVVVLRERLDLIKLASTIVTLSGAILLRFSR